MIQYGTAKRSVIEIGWVTSWSLIAKSAISCRAVRRWLMICAENFTSSKRPRDTSAIQRYWCHGTQCTTFWVKLETSQWIIMDLSIPVELDDAIALCLAGIKQPRCIRMPPLPYYVVCIWLWCRRTSQIPTRYLEVPEIKPKQFSKKQLKFCSRQNWHFAFRSETHRNTICQLGCNIFGDLRYVFEDKISVSIQSNPQMLSPVLVPGKAHVAGSLSEHSRDDSHGG